MIGQWIIRKAVNRLPPNWILHGPDGSYVGKFHHQIDAIRHRDHLVKKSFDEMQLWMMGQST